MQDIIILKEDFTSIEIYTSVVNAYRIGLMGFYSFKEHEYKDKHIFSDIKKVDKLKGVWEYE